MSDQRRRRPPDTLRPAGELLAGVFAQLGLEHRLREQEALAHWPQLVGPEIASRSKALRIREGVLYVQVTSAAWSQELRFLKARILAGYDAALSPGLVKDIRFTQH